MIQRQVEIDGKPWGVTLTGGVTQYERDEFALVFERREGQAARERRISRFSPLGSRSRQAALAELTDAELRTFFAQSQPEWTSPELGYARD